MWQTDPEFVPASDTFAWPAHVMQGVPAFITYIDTQRRVRFSNDTQRQWLAVGVENAIGRTVEEVFNPVTIERAGPCLDQALAGKTAIYEGELLIKQRRRYVHGSFQPDIDDDGKVRGVFTVFTDITARHTLEMQLRESEQRFYGAFQHAAIGMALIGPTGSLLKVNNALCDILGYTEEELVTYTILELTWPADLEITRQFSSELMRGQRDSYQLEKRYAHRDGHAVHALVNVSAVHDWQGTPYESVLLVQDISQRKTYEEALFRERDLAEVTLRSIGDAVITCDLQHRVTSLNPIAEAMTGWSQSEAVNRTLDEVFSLLDGQTRDTQPSPQRDAVARDTIVELKGHSVLVHRNGFETPIEGSAASIHDHAGNVIGGVLVFHDVSETRTLALKMAHLAQHDTLTGLPNRHVLQTRLEQLLTAARRRRSQVALLHFDLDHFKQVNDVRGHAGGDQLLHEFATFLRTHLRKEDTVARVGGDEFVALLSGAENRAEVVAQCESLLRLWRLRTPSSTDEAATTFSVGISLYPDDARDADSMLRHADVAMYDIKTHGGDAYRLFTRAMSERPTTRLRIEQDLRRAMRQGSLKLFYQPKVDADTGAVIGAEALLRWQMDGQTVYVPDQFIPIAEQTGLIVPLGEWVLKEACRQASAWYRAGCHIVVAVNVSAVQFQHDGFHDMLASALRETGLPPSLIELELTEHMVMTAGDQGRALIQRIKELGVGMALDDFGIGYSSLSYLKHFPFDTLKVDRSFVRDVATDTDSAAITDAIIAMARGLNMRVVAEGVETVEQATYLRKAGCAVLQGFLFGQAQSAEAFGRYLQTT